MLRHGHRHLLLPLLLLSALISTGTYGCNIEKAADCPPPPTADDEKIFKTDLYTREQLFQFCDQGKMHAECINKQLQCCNLRSEHADALTVFEVGLQQNGRRLGKYCAGLGANTLVQYKCKPTTTTEIITTSMASCEASKECNDILNGRLTFEASWTSQEKAQWCKAARDYTQCAEKHIMNCSSTKGRDDVSQLLWYIMREVNLNCPGGIDPCAYHGVGVRFRRSWRRSCGDIGSDSAASIIMNDGYLLSTFTISIIFIVRQWNT